MKLWELEDNKKYRLVNDSALECGTGDRQYWMNFYDKMLKCAFGVDFEEVKEKRKITLFRYLIAPKENNCYSYQSSWTTCTPNNYNTDSSEYIAHIEAKEIEIEIEIEIEDK